MNSDEADQDTNPYLLLGFWEFAIISTLMTLFFPWSLLFCLLFYGMEATKLLVQALLHDAVKTVFAVISILVCIALLIVFLVFVFGGG